MKGFYSTALKWCFTWAGVFCLIISMGAVFTNPRDGTLLFGATGAAIGLIFLGLGQLLSLAIRLLEKLEKLEKYLVTRQKQGSKHCLSFDTGAQADQPSNQA